MRAFHFVFLLVVVFLLNAVSSDNVSPDNVKISFTLSQTDVDKLYRISPTDTIQSSLGSLEVSLDANKCNTVLEEDDSTVFFEVKNGNKLCIILAYLNNGEKSSQVYAMQGTSCSITKGNDSDFVVAALDNELANCKWNGQKCAEITEGLRIDFQLQSADYQLTQQIESPYSQAGGRVAVDSESAGHAVLTNLYNGFLYFNITHKQENSWCLISAEAHLRDFHPMSLVYQAHDAVCTLKEIGYHAFGITAEQLEGASCTFDGLECKIPEELLREKSQ